MGLAYFSLGDDAEADAQAYLADYYAWLGEEIAGYIVSGAAKDAETVQQLPRRLRRGRLRRADLLPLLERSRRRSTCSPTRRASERPRGRAMADDLPVLLFATPAELEAWLEEQPRRLRGALAEDRQEGVERAERHLRRGARAGALLRLDRQPEARPRRAALPAALHAAAPARALVADQPREGRSADRRRRDAAGRPGRGRGGESRRPLGGGLRGLSAPPRSRTTCSASSTPTGRARVLRRASTAPTATRSSTASTRRKAARRGSGGCASSSRCSSAARRSTTRRAPETSPRPPQAVDGAVARPAYTRQVDRALLERTLADGRRARLPRRPGLGVGRARRPLLRGDDQPAGGAARAARRRGAALDPRAARPRRSPTTAPSRRSSTPPTGGRSRRC